MALSNMNVLGVADDDRQQGGTPRAALSARDAASRRYCSGHERKLGAGGDAADAEHRLLVYWLSVTVLAALVLPATVVSSSELLPKT